MPLFWAYFEGLGALGMCHYSICRIKGIHGNLPITKVFIRWQVHSCNTIPSSQGHTQLDWPFSSTAM